MTILFETFKWIFFFFSVIIWLFFLRWNYILSDANFNAYWNLLMPAYLALTWMMIWYVFASILIVKDDLQENEEWKTKAYTKWFVIWAITWVILALVYIFLI